MAAIQRLALALSQVNELSEQLRALAVPRFTPLTRLCGVNLLTAGVLAGMLGPGHRFKSDALRTSNQHDLVLVAVKPGSPASADTSDIGHLGWVILGSALSPL